MKFLFLPIGMLGALAAGQLSKKVFDVIRGRIDDEDAPRRGFAKATGSWPGEEAPEPA